MDSWTRARLGHVQTSPWLRAKRVNPSEGLVEVVIVLVHHVFEEDVGGFAAELEGDGDEVFGGVLHDESPGVGFAGERDFCDAFAAGEGLAGLDSEPVDDVDDAGGKDVGDDFHEDEDAGGGLLGGFDDDGVPAAMAGASFQAAMRMGKFQG